MTEPAPDPIEPILQRDADCRRADATPDLEDRIFVATQATIGAAEHRPSVIVRIVRIGAPLAAAAVVAIVIWTQSLSPIASGTVDVATVEQDIEALLFSDDWMSDLDDFESLFNELDELESSLAMDWSDDLSLLTDDFAYEESTQ